MTDTSTPGRNHPALDADAPRTTPAVYGRQVVTELRKTNWPTRPELIRSAGVTIAFTAASVAALTAADTGLGHLMVLLFG